jgi:hypothetical protein
VTSEVVNFNLFIIKDLDMGFHRGLEAKVVEMVRDLFNTLNVVELHEEGSEAEHAVGVKALKERYQLLFKVLNSAIHRGLEAKQHTLEDAERVVEIMKFLDLDIEWKEQKAQQEMDKLREFYGLKAKSFDVDNDLPPGGVYCHSNEPDPEDYLKRQGC